MSFYISIKSASSELTESPVNKSITHLAATIAIKTKHDVIPDGPSIDLTFLLPGKHEKPGFEGMRMGGYSKENNTLFFERAVPEHVVFSDEANHFVELVMQDVVENARNFFDESGIDFNYSQWKKLLKVLYEDNQHVRFSHYSQ